MRTRWLGAVQHSSALSSANQQEIKSPRAAIAIFSICLGSAFGKTRDGRPFKTYGAEMKTFARFLLVGTILVARCAWATEPSPVEFAKSVVSERGSQTFATLSYPDKNLIVEFRLEPYSAGKATTVRAFGEITKKIAQGAFRNFPKIKSVQLIGNLALRDKYGNDTVDRAIMVKF
jgi:hypothetical protein